jgi:hypothetical protein
MPPPGAGWGLGIPFNVGMGGSGCLDEVWTGFTEVNFNPEQNAATGTYQRWQIRCTQ